MAYSIFELNQMGQKAFVEALGAVFEGTPDIARQAWAYRPFADVIELHQRLMDVVQTMRSADQLSLIRAHPDLGSKADMAEVSAQEQTAAGLDRLTPDEYECFQRLNRAYNEQFGFPFVIAVKNHTKTSVLEAFQRRLNNPAALEIEQALMEIAQIAWVRLLERVG